MLDQIGLLVLLDRAVSKLKPPVFPARLRSKLDQGEIKLGIKIQQLDAFELLPFGEAIVGQFISKDRDSIANASFFSIDAMLIGHEAVFADQETTACIALPVCRK